MGEFYFLFHPLSQCLNYFTIEYITFMISKCLLSSCHLPVLSISGSPIRFSQDWGYFFHINSLSNSYVSPKLIFLKPLFNLKYDLSEVFSLLLTRWNHHYMDLPQSMYRITKSAKKKIKLTPLSQWNHQQTLTMPHCHVAGGRRPMNSARGITTGLNWGSSGSAIRTMSTPISTKVHKTPSLFPDHCHDRPKQLQSIVSMCI